MNGLILIKLLPLCLINLKNSEYYGGYLQLLYNNYKIDRL